jgi:hypothetical protein
MPCDVCGVGIVSVGLGWLYVVWRVCDLLTGATSLKQWLTIFCAVVCGVLSYGLVGPKAVAGRILCSELQKVCQDAAGYAL